MSFVIITFWFFLGKWLVDWFGLVWLVGLMIGLMIGLFIFLSEITYIEDVRVNMCLNLRILNLYFSLKLRYRRCTCQYVSELVDCFGSINLS